MRNVYGGGANTTINGNAFEELTDLAKVLITNGYKINENEVLKDNERVGLLVKKNSFYKDFLTPRGIDYKLYNSKKWLPDECFVNFKNKTVYIVEKKYQQSAGLVDEKLPNCDFKRKEYEKLCSPIKYSVEFLYVFNDWFKRSCYKDILEYVKDIGCNYEYNSISLSNLGLE